MYVTVVVMPIAIVVGSNKRERQSEKEKKARESFVARVLNKSRNTNHEYCQPSNIKALRGINNFFITAYDSRILYLIRKYYVYRTRKHIYIHIKY